MKQRTLQTRYHPELRTTEKKSEKQIETMPLKKKYRMYNTVARNGKYVTRTGASKPSRPFFNKSHGGYKAQ